VAGLAKSTIIFIWAIWKDCPTIQEIFLNIVLSGPTILGWPIAHFIFWLLYIVCQPFLVGHLYRKINITAGSKML
jgi:hypothetical protein